VLYDYVVHPLELYGIAAAIFAAGFLSAALFTGTK